MKIFADLRNLIRLERLYLPFINTLEDRDIAAQIGYHDVIRGEPLTLKLLYLLDIGSIATVQRRLLCFALFWHALDIVWIGVFTIVYLGAR